MTIRFAGARTGTGLNAILARRACTAVRLDAGNDNRIAPHRGPGLDPGADPGLDLALRHFAHHGLGAADQARANAESARERGDGEAFEHWLALCRMFDRRMAQAIRSRTAATARTS